MPIRINVTLPEATIRVINRLAQRGERSRFIERAVRHYVSTASPGAIAQRLKQAAIRDRDLDLSMAEKWPSD
jgi:CopG family transcriptional regulator / antitoxin EndoAI